MTTLAVAGLSEDEAAYLLRRKPRKEARMTTKTKSTAENGNAAAVQAAVDKAVAKTAKAKTVIALDINDLDLGDCIDVEEITGEPVVVTFASMDVGRVSAKALAALVWVAKRKSDPTFTFADAKRTKVTDLDAALGVESDAGQAQG